MKTAEHISYNHSGNISYDFTRVVGYNSVGFIK